MDISSFNLFPLNETTEILPFCCKDDELNNFLFDDAKKYLADLIAVTYLLVDRQAQKTVAYFSLLNDKVSYDPEERSLWNRINRKISNNKRRKTYPSVKIGRLAQPPSRFLKPPLILCCKKIRISVTRIRAKAQNFRSPRTLRVQGYVIETIDFLSLRQAQCPPPHTQAKRTAFKQSFCNVS